MFKGYESDFWILGFFFIGLSKENILWDQLIFRVPIDNFSLLGHFAWPRIVVYSLFNRMPGTGPGIEFHDKGR